MPKLLTARGPAMCPDINPQTKVKFVNNSSFCNAAHRENKLRIYLVKGSYKRGCIVKIFVEIKQIR